MKSDWLHISSNRLSALKAAGPQTGRGGTTGAAPLSEQSCVEWTAADITEVIINSTILSAEVAKTPTGNVLLLVN